MKINNFFVLLLLTAAILSSCLSGGTGSQDETSAADGSISARGAIGGLQATPTTPMFTGDGGRNIQLAVLAPDTHGDVPDYLPLYIQGLLNNNFSRFSNIRLIDRQNLNRIITEQNIAASGNYSDVDFVRMGNLTNAQFFLFGTIQRLPGNQFSLQLSVTEASSGIRRASFIKVGILAQLEGRGTLLNEATAELLSQLGIQLTDAGKQALLAGNMSTVQAEAGLARGITAQAGGSEVQALFNFAQAITFNPEQMEAASRLTSLSTTISGGTISQRIQNDLQARDSWIEAFKEATQFFNSHPPFEIIFDPNLIQIGETDFVKRTANLGMRIEVNPSEAGFNVLNTLLEGLERTGRRSAWGFAGWPFMELNPRTAGTVVFNGRRTFSYKVDVALVNENNKQLGRSSITLNTDIRNFSSGDKTIALPSSVAEIVSFLNVRAEDLTPTLTIVIVAVNGVSSNIINSTGYMKIETGNLQARITQRQQEAAEIDIARQARENERIARDNERKKARQVRSGNAAKDVLGASGYYQFADSDNNGYGLELNLFFTLIPYTVIGADMRIGAFGDEPPQSETESSSGGTNDNTGEGTEDSNMMFTFSPAVGFVIPFSGKTVFFANAMLDMGNFGYNLNGLISEKITPSFCGGFMFKGAFYSYLIKYRYTMYEELNTHSVSLGIGLSFASLMEY
ncbi:MAG: hypothetical protein FWD22_04750 [Treponema sp.]|nr:hypothetical protein [Treponema sp.]